MYPVSRMQKFIILGLVVFKVTTFFVTLSPQFFCQKSPTIINYLCLFKKHLNLNQIQIYYGNVAAFRFAITEGTLRKNTQKFYLKLAFE
jgi:hypothetical protein